MQQYQHLFRLSIKNAMKIRHKLGISFACLLWLGLVLWGCEDLIEPHACYLPPEAGACEAAIPKYYFDKRDGKCKEFTWGGCGGIVPFDELEACENACECEAE